MTCDEAREAASARLDNEPIGVSPSALEDHLNRCPACAAWLADAVTASRAVRVHTVAVPDLTDVILAAVPVPRRRVRRVALARLALAVAGLYQVALFALGALGDDTGMTMPMHSMHESAAWNGGLGLAFLIVAARPRLASGSLPALAGFVVLLIPLSVHDVLAHDVGADRLVTHLGCLVGLALTVVLSRTAQDPAPQDVRTVMTGGSENEPELKGLRDTA